MSTQVDLLRHEDCMLLFLPNLHFFFPFTATTCAYKDRCTHCVWLFIFQSEIWNPFLFLHLSEQLFSCPKYTEYTSCVPLWACNRGQWEDKTRDALEHCCSFALHQLFWSWKWGAGQSMLSVCTLLIFPSPKSSHSACKGTHHVDRQIGEKAHVMQGAWDWGHTKKSSLSILPNTAALHLTSPLEHLLRAQSCSDIIRMFGISLTWSHPQPMLWNVANRWIGGKKARAGVRMQTRYCILTPRTEVRVQRDQVSEETGKKCGKPVGRREYGWLRASQPWGQLKWLP